MEKTLNYFFIFLFIIIVFVLLFTKNKKEKYTTLGKIGEKIKQVMNDNDSQDYLYDDNDDFGKYRDDTHYDRQSIRKSRGQIQHDYHE